jgi:hypothetical protein
MFFWVVHILFFISLLHSSESRKDNSMEWFFDLLRAVIALVVVVALGMKWGRK